MGSSSEPDILLGLIGAGIQASRAPAMHQREAGGTWPALHLQADRSAAARSRRRSPGRAAHGRRTHGFRRPQLTHPCKQAVIPLLTELSDDAKALARVNTVLLRGGRRIGHNTDWSGFAESFRRGLSGAALGRCGVRSAPRSGCRSGPMPPRNLVLASSQFSISISIDRRRLRGKSALASARVAQCQVPISRPPLR